MNPFLIPRRRKRLLGCWLSMAFLSPIVATSQELEEVRPSEIRDIIVDQTRDANPKTVAEMLRAVGDLVNVQAYDAANETLEKILAANLKPSEMAELQEEFGSAFFLRLLRAEPVRDLGSKVTDKISAGADQFMKDPKQLARWIKDVIHDEEEIRLLASAALRRVGAGAVPALLRELTDDQYSTSQRQRLEIALAGIGESAVGPLVAALASGTTSIISQAALELGHLPAQPAVPFLLRPCLDPKLPQTVRNNAARTLIKLTGMAPPSLRSAEKLLRAEFDRLISDPTAVPGDINDESKLWVWNPDEKTVQQKTFPRDTAALLLATWLADDLIKLNAGDGGNRRRYLMAYLGWTQLQLGFDQPIPATTLVPMAARLAMAPHEIDRVLSEALDQRVIPSAVAAAELLGHTGDLDLLCSCRGKPSTLARALRDPDQRVRFSAAEAILRLDPRKPFVGASDLIETLVFAAGASGQKKILVAHPRADESNLLAALLRTLGYEPTVVGNGKAALRVARQDPDMEMILVSDAVDKAPWNLTVQQLAFDRYSKDTPKCIVARSRRLALAADVANQLDHTESFPFPHDRESLLSLLQLMLPQSGNYATSANDRLQLADRALKSMSRLLEFRQQYVFYEFLPYEDQLVQALGVPVLSPSAADVLGYLATPVAQTALVEFASQSALSLADRQRAAAALEHAIDRAGLMLTQPQILQQYQRYNEIRDVDDESASVLSRILDSIEKPSTPISPSS